MKVIRSINIFVLTVVFLLPMYAHAETVLRISDSVSLSDDQTVSGDFYGLAETMSLSGTVAGDAHLVGGKTTLNGSVEEDLFILSGVSEVHASVTDDVRIVSGEVTIAEHVGGDLFVVGGVLKVLSTATIDGNIYFFGGEAEINGAVNGSIFGALEKMRIDGPVGGSVDITVARPLVLGDRASIEGDVLYESFEELIRAQNAVIVGEVQIQEPRTGVANPRDVFVPFIVYAFSVLILFALFRSSIRSLVVDASRSFVRNGLIGAVTLFAIPFATALLLLTVIGLILGIFVFFTYTSLMILSTLLVSAFVGVLLEKTFQKTERLSLMWMIAGIVATELVLLVPVIGPVVFVVALMAVSGTLIHTCYKSSFDRG